MDTIKAAKEFIKKGIALLPDNAKAEWKASASPSGAFINEAIEEAAKVLDEPVMPETNEAHLEKLAMLEAYAVQEANRMASTLWRLELITETLEKEYRKLPSMDEVVGPYNTFLAARQARVDELTEKGNEIQKEKREMEIFMGIINGVPAEKSEEEYEAFRKSQQAAMTGGR